MRKRGGWLLIGAFALICWGLLASGEVSVRAQSPNQAALVIRLDDETTISRCVEFKEPEISGYEVLVRSGVDFVSSQSSGMGSAICRIADVGCSAVNCFCQCQGSSCLYWTYWTLGEEGWTYSLLGASIHVVSDGSIEGWSWGPDSPPPDISFQEVCAPSVLPTASPLPTRQATSTPTDEPATAAAVTPQITLLPPTPTASPTPSALPAATLTPTASPTVGNASTIWNTQQVDAPGAGYVFLGLIVLGLAMLLAVVLLRKH